MSTIEPASGATAGVLPRDLSPIEAFVAERRVAPWPPEWSPYGRGDLSGGDIDAMALYKRYCADVGATGHRPLSQPRFGEAMGAVPGITRHREATGWYYSGLTIETRAERVYATVHDALFGAEMAARSSEPWVERHTTHRVKHVETWMRTGSGFDCDHDQPPDVVAGLADVEATTAPAVAAEVARYAPYTTAVIAPGIGPASDEDPEVPEDPFADY